MDVLDFIEMMVTIFLGSLQEQRNEPESIHVDQPHVRQLQLRNDGQAEKR